MITVAKDPQSTGQGRSRRRSPRSAAALPARTPRRVCPLGACGGTCRRTPKLSLPLDGAADLAGWAKWTSCSGCQPGTFDFVANGGGGGGFARVASHDLPCAGDCSYPGAYAASAPAASGPGELFLHFAARASGAGADLGLIALDGTGAQIGETPTRPPTSTG